jgi:hypothetical protein
VALQKVQYCSVLWSSLIGQKLWPGEEEWWNCSAGFVRQRRCHLLLSKRLHLLTLFLSNELGTELSRNFKKKGENLQPAKYPILNNVCLCMDNGYTDLKSSAKYWGDNLRRLNAIPVGVGETDWQIWIRRLPSQYPPHPLSHTIDMAFGDWSCHLWSFYIVGPKKGVVWGEGYGDQGLIQSCAGILSCHT